MGLINSSPRPSNDETSIDAPSKSAVVIVVSVAKNLYVIVFRICLFKLFILISQKVKNILLH